MFTYAFQDGIPFEEIVATINKVVVPPVVVGGITQDNDGVVTIHFHAATKEEVAAAMLEYTHEQGGWGTTMEEILEDVR